MRSLNDNIQEYRVQLRKGHIQKAYAGMISFMSELRQYLMKAHPEYIASSLYAGYMDMSYFSFTPADFKEKNLKIAIVYLHEKGIFEVWLAGNNKKIQSEYIELLSHRDIGNYVLSKPDPGVDSIIESILVETPDFDNYLELKVEIEMKLIEYIKDIRSFVS